MYFTNIFYKNYHSEKQIIVNIGGARSSKSYSILQLLFVYFMNFKNKKFLIVRKTRPSLKISCWFDFNKIIKEEGIYSLLDVNKSDLTIYYHKNNNIIFFRSLDDAEKIKSTDFNYIFIEEASEFEEEDYQLLKFRLSAKTKKLKNKLFLALNPVECWVQDILNKEDFDIIKSTYKDNPFLTPDYIKMLEDLKYQNEHLYRIYVLGEFSKLPNLIYNNYEIISDDEYNKIVSETIYGLDFGFNNPTALVEVKICDDKIFLREMLYKTNLTNQDLINYLKELEIKKNCEIYCDGAEPQRIEELYKAGFNAKPSKKEVIDGIDLIKRKKLYITKSSSSLIKEIKSYSYKIDKAGKILEEPVKFNDHLMDAMRYAIYTHTKDYSFKIKAYKSLIRDIDFK